MLHHDMRSALSDVLNGLDLIDDSALSEDSRLQIDRVRAAAATLGPLIDEALFEVVGETAFSDMLADGARVPLLDLLRSIERRWSGLARAQGLALETDFASDLPILVRLDGRALERILSNLIGNATKYTERGTVTLTVDVRPGGDLRFRVVDDGPGFSDAALARLFEYGGRPGDSGRPGSGMGLHICKSLADGLGGHVEVANGPARGAQISLVLPEAAWRDPVPGGERALPDLGGLRVLVAEDNPTNQAIFRQMLEHMGAVVQIREDGRAAFAALSEGDFDIALVDIEMPEMSGTDLISAVRALPGARGRIPVLAVTAYVLRACREEIYRAGADGIVAKPVESFLAFGESIRALMDRARSRAGRNSGPVPATGRGHPRPASGGLHGPGGGVRPGGSRGLPGGTDAGASGASGPAASPGPSGAACEPGDRFHELLAMAGPDGRAELLRRLQDDLGLVARNLGEAAAGRDWMALRAETHILISLAGAVGAEPLLAAAQAMNAAAHAEDSAAVDRLAAPMLRDLDRLLGRVRAVDARDAETGEA